MRLSIVSAIYKKEMLDLVRDRRALISMAVVPLFVFPLLVGGMSRLLPRMAEKSEEDAKALGFAERVSTPSIREAIEKTGMRLFERDDLKSAVEQKSIAAAVEEVPGSPAGSPPEIRIYVDASSPTSDAAGNQIREALDGLRERRIREGLRKSGIDESVLSPFTINRVNIAGQRKMAGLVWGAMLGYLLLLLMFTGGMYPVMDMTVGEKERKTLEAFLVSPALRREIVFGKTLAAITSILVTAALTLFGMVYSLKNTASSAQSKNGAELRQMMGTIPLDPGTVTLIALTLIPLAIFAASVMFAIALKARSFKEAQTYLTPLLMLVIFPALLGGLPGFTITPVLCLIPIFNASQIIRGVRLGDVSMVNFGVTLAANLVYASIAFFMATRMFEDENVLFRT